MKKSIALITSLLLCLTMIPSALGEPLVLVQPLAGESAYPEGSTQDNAHFLLTYTYPQVAAAQEADENINAYYADAVQELIDFTAPALADEAAGSTDTSVPAYLNITYQITANTDDFFCVLLTQEQFMGASVGQTTEANVFARKGDSAGGIATLPDVLGFDREDESSATDVIDTAYELVWEIIKEQIKSGSVDYFEDLTEEDMFAEFFPDSDFYLDGQGNIVFYIEPGMVASEAAGLITFPFAPAELLSAMPKQ